MSAFVLYVIALPSSVTTLPPACSTTAWAAAVSHSDVGPKPRVDVGTPFGDHAEFQRTAHGHHVVAAERREKGIEAGAAV